MRLSVAFILAAGLLAPTCAVAEPFLPSDRSAVDLALGRRTDGFTTVGRTLAYAERASHGAFSPAGYRVERRPGEPYIRVGICYRLGHAPPVCGLDYLVTTDPPHAEPADRTVGLGRDLEHGPRAFLRALAREDALQRQPALLQRLRAALEPLNPYDWR